MKLENDKVIYFDRDGKETETLISTLKEFEKSYYKELSKSQDLYYQYVSRKFEEIRNSFPELFL